uniref:Uncharacterized protein n=1 Tax=Lepeophtheirus salmonis TaxID=72036 RepID=A0A0K2TDR7_LEPSM
MTEVEKKNEIAYTICVRHGKERESIMFLNTSRKSYSNTLMKLSSHMLKTCKKSFVITTRDTTCIYL